jgi:hypothetical protein
LLRKNSVVPLRKFFVGERATDSQNREDGFLTLSDSLNAQRRFMRRPHVTSPSYCAGLGIEETVHDRAANSSSRISRAKR